MGPFHFNQELQFGGLFSVKPQVQTFRTMDSPFNAKNGRSYHNSTLLFLHRPEISNHLAMKNPRKGSDCQDRARMLPGTETVQGRTYTP
jgi:hypothetical protein